jgi:hypothetical protein
VADVADAHGADFLGGGDAVCGSSVGRVSTDRQLRS